MKRVLSLLISLSLILSACTQNRSIENVSEPDNIQADTPLSLVDNESAVTEKEMSTPDVRTGENESASDDSSAKKNDSTVETDIPHFMEYSDPELWKYIEGTVSTDIDEKIEIENYKLANIQTQYISQDYLDRLEYNSKTNIYFGYSLAEVEKEFGDEKYVFTLGDDGTTVVVPFEKYDDTYDRVIKNVATGSGVILITALLAPVSYAAGAPAIAVILAFSAKTAYDMALSTAAISAVIEAAVTGYRTGDFEKTVKASALAGSEGLKFGAITGAIFGGVDSALFLSMLAHDSLTIDMVAKILIEHPEIPTPFIRLISSWEEYEELILIAERHSITIEKLAHICLYTDYPLNIAKYIRTVEECDIYAKDAHLISKVVDGKEALVREIDLAYKSDLSGKVVTNLERMQQGYAPIDPLTGKAYELHHIGQDIDSPLAILTKAEHMGGGNNGVLHDLSINNGKGVHSILSDTEWATQREEFWKGMAELFMNGGL